MSSIGQSALNSEAIIVSKIYGTKLMPMPNLMLVVNLFPTQERSAGADH